jgi:hypothetical protein
MYRKLKIDKIIIWFIVLFIFGFIGFSNSTKTDSISVNPKSSTKGEEAVDLRIQDYFPKKGMKKYFTGGFENAGFIQIIDKFEGDKAQIKQLDSGTGVALVYQVTEMDIKIIFGTEVGDGKFKDDYIGTVTANRNDILLKAPILVGTKWTNDRERKCEITGVNVKVKTPAGTFYTIEVTNTSGEYLSKDYYAKDLGLVRVSTKGYDDSLLIKIE